MFITLKKYDKYMYNIDNIILLSLTGIIPSPIVFLPMFSLVAPFYFPIPPLFWGCRKNQRNQRFKALSVKNNMHAKIFIEKISQESVIYSLTQIFCAFFYFSIKSAFCAFSVINHSVFFLPQIAQHFGLTCCHA